MRYDTVATLIRNLNEAGVTYLVVGGLAVVAHGYVRLTMDVDLIIGLDPVNTGKAVAVLKAMAYWPRAPVPFDDFADSAKRQVWVAEKGMTVFALSSAAYPETEVDIFVEDLLGLDKAMANVVPLEIAQGVIAPVCSVADLIKLKKLAGRPRDLLDIEKLLVLHPEIT